MNILMHYEKSGWMRFIGHLDMVSVLERAIRRAGYPLSYTGGFNPTPKLSLIDPLSLGVSSTYELAQVLFEEEIDLETFPEKLNAQLPEGVVCHGVKVIPLHASYSRDLYASRYRFDLPETVSVDQDLVDRINEAEPLMADRTVKRKKRLVHYQIDIKPLVYKVERVEGENALEAVISSSQNAHLNARQFLETVIKTLGLDLNMDDVLITRTGQYDVAMDLIQV